VLTLDDFSEEQRQKYEDPEQVARLELEVLRYEQGGYEDPFPNRGMRN